MDKSAFYKFSTEEKTQGIAYLLIEMFKIRSTNILNMHKEVADEYFKLKWSKPVTRYRIIKSCANLKVPESRKCSKHFQFWSAKTTMQKQ